MYRRRAPWRVNALRALTFLFLFTLAADLNAFTNLKIPRKSCRVAITAWISRTKNDLRRIQAPDMAEIRELGEWQPSKSFSIDDFKNANQEKKRALLFKIKTEFETKFKAYLGSKALALPYFDSASFISLHKKTFGSQLPDIFKLLEAANTDAEVDAIFHKDIESFFNEAETAFAERQFVLNRNRRIAVSSGTLPRFSRFLNELTNKVHSFCNMKTVALVAIAAAAYPAWDLIHDIHKQSKAAVKNRIDQQLVSPKAGINAEAAIHSFSPSHREEIFQALKEFYNPDISRAEADNLIDEALILGSRINAEAESRTTANAQNGLAQVEGSVGWAVEYMQDVNVQKNLLYQTAKRYVDAKNNGASNTVLNRILLDKSQIIEVLKKQSMYLLLRIYGNPHILNKETHLLNPAPNSPTVPDPIMNLKALLKDPASAEPEILWQQNLDELQSD